VSTAPFKIGVLLSGTGRTLANLLQHRQAGNLPVDFACVLSSKDGVRGLTVAQEAGIPTAVLARRDHDSEKAYGRALCARLRQAKVDLVILAGFVHFLAMEEDFAGRVLNIHPALLPDFGGRGYYGHHVHEAVLAAGVPESGCTVHIADHEYDHGPIVLQRRVPVMAEDTPDTLAARVFAAECLAFPEAIRLWIQQHPR
jgi:phosphoribosylglycinamide formyltransferase-1